MTWTLPLAEEQNKPPTLLGFSKRDGEEFTVEPGVFAYVTAQDPDSFQPLSFQWSAGNEPLFDVPQLNDPGVEDDENPIFPEWFSQVDVPYDAELDGEELTCRVYDTEGGSVEISWPMVVL